MLTQIALTQPKMAEPTSDLAAKLKQLRRLRVTTGEQSSLHLQSALQAARTAPPAATPEVSYIFIGISLPKVVPTED